MRRKQVIEKIEKLDNMKKEKRWGIPP